MKADAAAVLGFWFGEPPFATRAEWFRKSDEFDRDIDQRFGALIQQALRGEHMDWRQQPETSLARILLLDQFTRNVFRNTARAFAGDALALAASRELVATGSDQALHPLQRLFVYLPFEHAEDLAMQDESMRLFTRLEIDAPEHAKGLLDYAQRHRDILARFGRFPHRNALLGRASTEEELAFLSQPGSSF